VAFKRFVIAPEPVAGLDWVKAEHDSPYGLIRREWRRENGAFVLEVEVPVNTEANRFLAGQTGCEECDRRRGARHVGP
jgi:alpha-L-rhamnosidase